MDNQEKIRKKLLKDLAAIDEDSDYPIVEKKVKKGKILK